MIAIILILVLVLVLVLILVFIHLLAHVLILFDFAIENFFAAHIYARKNVQDLNFQKNGPILFPIFSIEIVEVNLKDFGNKFEVKLHFGCFDIEHPSPVFLVQRKNFHFFLECCNQFLLSRCSYSCSDSRYFNLASLFYKTTI